MNRIPKIGWILVVRQRFGYMVAVVDGPIRFGLNEGCDLQVQKPRPFVGVIVLGAAVKVAWRRRFLFGARHPHDRAREMGLESTDELLGLLDTPTGNIRHAAGVEERVNNTNVGDQNITRRWFGFMEYFLGQTIVHVQVPADITLPDRFDAVRAVASSWVFRSSR